MFLKRITSIGLAAMLLTQYSCKDKPTDIGPVKDPRTYTWTIDTLSYHGSFQTLMLDIYASSGQDVWTVGYNATSGGKMYHYDGKQWTDVKLYVTQGGKIETGINLNAMYGFGANNIWSVGERHYTIQYPQFVDSSLIIHFDGRDWTEYSISRGGELQSIWGSNPSDVWAAGINTLYHLDGTVWEKFPISIPSQGIQFLSIAGTGSTEVYMIGYRNDVVQPIDTNAYFLYRFNGKQWAVVDSSIRTTDPSSEYKFGWGLSAVSGVIFSGGYGVFKKSGDQWERMFHSEWGLRAPRGTSLQNLFAVGAESRIYHFNGVDWYRYPQFKGLDKLFTSVWTNGSEVFVVGYTSEFPQKSVVLHGK